ncbi:MAG TPA: hypothetical protein VK956_07285 [Verrucomicrobium sp.]|nr:hypothetical protein [Verrucomicrobium sp.]
MIPLPQSTLLSTNTLTVAVLLGMLGACSTKVETTTATSHYQKILKDIKPGISRQQLYAILPPFSHPVAKVPQSSFRGPRLENASELHPLDNGHFVEIRYKLSPSGPQIDNIDLLMASSADGGMPSVENPRDTIVRISGVQRNL